MAFSIFESSVVRFDANILYGCLTEQPGTCWLPSVLQIESLLNSKVVLSDERLNKYIERISDCIGHQSLPMPRLAMFKDCFHIDSLGFIQVLDNDECVIAEAALKKRDLFCRVTFGKRASIESHPAFKRWETSRPNCDLFGESIMNFDGSIYEASCCPINRRINIKSLDGTFILEAGLNPYRVTLYERGVMQPVPSVKISSEQTEPISCSAFFDEILSYLPSGFDSGRFYLWFGYCFFDYFEGAVE